MPTAAQAQVNPLPVRNATNLMPNDNYEDKDQLSDGFDGVDSLAHLTAIADPRATQAEFFVCTGATATGAAIGTNACRSLGVDTTGTQPVPPSGTNETFNAGSFEAYEVFADIPAAEDNQTRTVVSRICNGAPSADVKPSTPNDTQSGTPVNCRDTFEFNIELDDSATGTGGGQAGAGQQPPLGTTGQDLPTGEITGICVGTEAACTPVGGTTQGGAAGTGTGTFAPLPHGANLPTTDFSLRFRTSADVTAAGSCLATITGDSVGTDAGTTGQGSNNPAPCSTFPTSTVKTDVGNTGVDNQTSFNEYTSRFVALTGNTRNVDVAIFGDGNDQLGECNNAALAAGFGTGNGVGGNSGTTGTNGSTALVDGDICVFDEHYAVFTAQTQSGLTLTFNNNESANPPAGTTTCGNADTAETNRLGDQEIVTACLTDQFGNRTAGTITFESRGVGTLECSTAARDVNGNPTAFTPSAPQPGTAGDTQRCTATAVNGRAFARLTNASATVANTPPAPGGRTQAPGDQTVTACVDRTASASNPAGCGTADTPISNSVVKTWIQAPDSVQLVFDDGDVATDCDNGDTFKVNAVGDTDTLLACVVDINGNPVSTQNTGNTGETQNTYSLTFFIPGGQGEESVVFASNPPTETDEDGEAEVIIRAIEEGSDTICVNVNGAQGNGAGNTQACVTKTVEGTDEPAAQCNDGIDNDGDGRVDFGSGASNDPGCASIDDNTEDGGGPVDPGDPEEVRRARSLEITAMRHVTLPGKKKPALLVKGRVGAENFDSCAAEVPVKIQIRAGGEWITRKSDTTNANGVFKVLIRDVAARYRAVATKFLIEDTTANQTNICLKAKDTQRHGHRRG